MNLKSLAVCIALFGVPLLTCQAADSPSLDEILARNIQAHGGKAALQKHKARVMKGTMEMNGTSSPVEVYALAPNKVFTQTEITGMGTITEGFDGQIAWSKNPWEGLKIKSGDELLKAKRDADLQRPLRMKEVYPGLTVKGREKLGTNEVYVLEAKPTATSSETFYIDTKSGLTIRQRSTLNGSAGEVRMTADLRSYKAVDGVQYPHEVDLLILAGGQEMKMTLKIRQVTHPVSIEASRFAKPAS